VREGCCLREETLAPEGEQVLEFAEPTVDGAKVRFVAGAVERIVVREAARQDSAQWCLERQAGCFERAGYDGAVFDDEIDQDRESELNGCGRFENVRGGLQANLSSVLFAINGFDDVGGAFDSR